jgi:hypothetical protein
MAGIEAEIIQKMDDQISGFKKAIETAGHEGRNKLNSIKIDELLEDLPRKDGKFDTAGWGALDADKQKQLYQRVVLVRDALHAAAEMDWPADSKHIMSAEYASNTSIVLLTLIGFLLTTLLLIAIVFLWDQATGNAPAPKNQTAAAALEKPKAAGEKPVEPISEGIVLTMVILLGALGGSLHLVSSLVKFIGNRQLKRSWLPYYLAMPFTGAGLAPVVYMLLRVGLITPSGTSTTGGAGFANLNLMAIYAFAVMTGLFSRVALDKLGEVFGTIFRTQTAPSKDALGAQKPPGGTATAGGKSS